MKDNSQQVFNSNGRKKNITRASTIGVVTNFIKILIAFVSRTVFLYVLSEQYLGINGLFSNVLSLLTLADLGVTTALNYRFYAPINANDVEQVGRLMNYAKKVYRIIAFTIMSLGLCMLPFLRFMVNSTEQLPKDVNLYLIYVLYLANVVTSYLFAYKQTLLSADQRTDLVSLWQVGCSLFTVLFQIVVLLHWRNYTFYLTTGIISNLIVNFLISLWITMHYRPVFRVKGEITKQEKRQIIEDTKACMLHKVGATVLTGTDNLVLTKMISLSATGLYSNYTVVLTNLQNILGQLLGNFVSSIGSAKICLDSEEHYHIYRKMNFLDLMLTSFTTICLYSLINDFIVVWIGDKYLLNDLTVVCLCLQHFFAISRIINTSYTNACGLFIKDRYRPLIEAAINLGISILLAKKIGIAGVFLGTIVSHILTVGWREPMILFRDEFHKSQFSYWKEYIFFLMLTLITSGVIALFKHMANVSVTTWFTWICEAIVVALLSAGILWLLFHDKEEFRYFENYVKSMLKRIMRRFFNA